MYAEIRVKIKYINARKRGLLQAVSCDDEQIIYYVYAHGTDVQIVSVHPTRVITVHVSGPSKKYLCQLCK